MVERTMRGFLTCSGLEMQCVGRIEKAIMIDWRFPSMKLGKVSHSPQKLNRCIYTGLNFYGISWQIYASTSHPRAPFWQNRA